MRTEHQTTLKDVDGNPHQYEITQHPATEGLRLFQRVLDSIAHPAGALLGAFQSAGALPETTSQAMTLLLDDSIKGEALGQAVEIFVGKVGADMDLFTDLLKYTYRDGSSLSGRAVFDNAYQGNYYELFAAVAWSLKVNFASMLPAGGFPFQSPGSARKQKQG